MATAPTRVGVKLIFHSPYRGGTKAWSQLWHFTGADWSGQSQFNTLVDALVAQLQGLIPSDTSIVEAIGYNAGSSVPVFTYTHTWTGTSSATSSARGALEDCALVKFTTTQRSKKNHPIYLFKWFHAVYNAGAGSNETLLAGLKTNINANMNTILAGLSDGTNTRQYCGPFGAVAQSRITEDYIHCREFPT